MQSSKPLVQMNCVHLIVLQFYKSIRYRKRTCINHKCSKFYKIHITAGPFKVSGSWGTEAKFNHSSETGEGSIKFMDNMSDQSQQTSRASHRIRIRNQTSRILSINSLGLDCLQSTIHDIGETGRDVISLWNEEFTLRISLLWEDFWEA